MSFKLPKLLYSYKDFEPYIDRKTMEIHYEKHHASYTNNLNKCISGTEMENFSIEKIMKKSCCCTKTTTLRNNSGGFYNHNLFWEILIPNYDYTDPSHFMTNAIVKDFNSFESFKNQFSAAAINRFGSGWAWLCIKEKKLAICSTQNQDNPIMSGIGCEGYPILGLDVWEHAYYLQYQNRRSDYVSSFWKIINWKKVEENYKKLINNSCSG
ncbi:superoxide dismutase [Blattabacterium cuenoti]|uniref:superoxide dismutase n=1 Tax=Blattabacterium cuenoti TaxID=1653831 RepID=UPI00163D39E4|nr:superoxide dismutase [Blattabacterium cuenoti]